MADLLGSILGAMERPPTMDDKERKKVKAQKAFLEKQQAMEKKRLEEFRQKTQKQLHDFIKDGTLQKCQLEPMDKVHRTIVHEVAEVAGLTSFSFGQEEEDRYVMCWKKEFAPSDEELLAYRKGEEWDPEKAKEMSRLKELAAEAEKKERTNSPQELPASNYRDKYKHLIGDEAAKDAAREMKSNTSYGIVPSTNKRDLRTIEQVMADSRAKKKQKLEQSSDVQETTATTGDDGDRPAISSSTSTPSCSDSTSST